MSGIQRLKIKGIRAFSEEKPAVIEVLTPLTIIVGTNGAGKTTLLECMKYATTGALPPNSKNGAFIHDPLLSKEGETKAQVLMKFSGCNGKEYLLLRTMLQTAGRAKRETKTLESALWEITNQEKKLICNKLSSLDSEVPLLLGTSSAVLEHVIFCHQEESTWPLSDPAAVKKKMDGIFSSSKFGKALEALISLKKDKSSDLKLLSLKHSALAQRLQVKKKIQERIKRITIREKEILLFLSQATEDAQALSNSLQEEKKQKEIILSYLREKERNQAELLGLQTSSLTDLPIDQLEALLEASPINSPEEAEKALSLLLSRKKHLLSSISLHEQKQRRAEEATREAAEKRIRISQIEEAARKRFQEEIHKLPLNPASPADSNGSPSDFPSPLPPANSPVHALSEYLENLQKISEKRIKKQEEISEEEQRALSSSYREARETISILTERLASLSSQRSKKIHLKEEIKDEPKENEENLLKELQQERRKAEESKAEETKEYLVRRMEELKDSLSEAIKETEKRKEKQCLREEAERKKKMYKEKALSLNIQEESLSSIEEKENQLKEEIKKIEKRVKEQETSRALTRERKTENEAKIKAISLIKEKKIKRVTELLSKVDSLQGTTKAEVLEAVKEGVFLLLSPQPEEPLLEEQEKIGGLKASKSIYSRFLEKAKSSCPFCRASLSDILAKPHLQKIQSILREIQNREAEAEQLFLLKQAKQKKTKEYNTVILQINEVLSIEEYFALPKQEPAPSPQHEHLNVSLQASIKSLLSLQEAKALLKEALYLSDREQNIHLKATDHHSEYNRCIADLEALHDTEKRENHPHEEERLRDSSKKRIKEIEELLYRRKRVKVDPLLLEEEIRRIEEEQRATEESLREAQKEAETIQAKEADLNRRRKSLKTMQIDRSILTYFLTEKTKVEEIEKRLLFLSQQAYTEESKEESTLLFQEKQQMEEEEALLRKALHEIREKESIREMIKQSIRAQRLKKRIEDSPYSPIHLTEKEESIREKEKRHQAGLESISEAKGEAGNLKKQREEDEKEVLLYKNTEEEELSAYVEIKVLRESLTDIDKYIKAVQKGIVRYHSEKLQEVNAIIKEIWDMTYKGGDIESIRIVAQMDKAYTLMMERDGVEVEMRGRVSAGQKMLASIVVRLALAEAFSINCGLLSLDEPTTNLDKKNIHSLARGLSSIIQARRAEGSFQLLVITHDEEFVRELLKTECTEYFYRLERDTDNHPKIERFSIYE